LYKNSIKGKHKAKKGEDKMPNKMKETKNNRKHDGKFKKLNIKHDSQAESAREVFGKKQED
jgi:hypothetical protein